MAKKNNSSNNVVPFLFVVALAVGGGYYLGTRSTSTKHEELVNEHSENVQTYSEDAYENDLDATEPLLEEEQNMAAEVGEVASPVAENEQTMAESTQTTTQKKTTTRKPVARTVTFDAKHDNSLEPVKKNQNEGTQTDEFGNIIYTGKQTSGSRSSASSSNKGTNTSRTNSQHARRNTVVRYVTHYQGRWGYSYICPSFLSKENRSQNDDGHSFEDGKGMKLSTYGGWNSLNESLTDLYRKDYPGIQSVTYKRLLRSQHSYVKSGYTSDNKIFYLKETLVKKGQQEMILTLFLSYPKNCPWQMDKIINEVFGRFPIIN